MFCSSTIPKQAYLDKLSLPEHPDQTGSKSQNYVTENAHLVDFGKMVDGIYFFSTFPEGPKGLTVPVLFTQAHTLMVALLLNSGTNLYPPEVMWGSVSGQVT